MIRGRTCAEGGLLVGGRMRLASDPCEYFHPAVTSVGCNRLRCSRCGEWVRSEPGLSAAWRDPRFVRALPECRRYACRCSAWVETFMHEVENDHDAATEPDVPWACQGHPAPELPLTLGELTITADTDWAKVVARILGGTCPRPLERDQTYQLEGPGNWLAWLYAYLAGLPIAERLSSAIADRAGDDDPLVVGRVLMFFSRFARAPGIERVIARAEADPRQVAVGYPLPEWYDPLTLWDVLIARLEQRGDQRALDERASALVRQVLLIPLSSLSHEDRGPDIRDLERERRKKRPVDIESLDEYVRRKRRQRVDVVSNLFDRASTAFNDVELRVWIADHITQIDAAAKGRWRLFMSRLADWHAKPQTGHLIIVAGMRLIESGTVTVEEFRDWMKNDLAYGWRDDAWVKPLETVLERKERHP